MKNITGEGASKTEAPLVEPAAPVKRRPGRPSHSRQTALEFFAREGGFNPVTVSKHQLQEALMLSHNTVNKTMAYLIHEGFLTVKTEHNIETGAQLANTYQLTAKGIEAYRHPNSVPGIL